MVKIHQFTPSITQGDGVSNGVFYIQKILKELGFISYIYAGDIDKTLKNEVISYKKIDKNDTSQILLIHYSIYYDFSTWIDKLKCKKIIIYHNITPYQFFKKGTLLYKLCKKGVEYLPELSKKVDGAIGVSTLNSKELIENGFKGVETIPLLIDTNKILKSKWNYKLFDKIIEKFTIIFVGRIARNKAQHDLIKIASFYKKINSNFKFYIIGGTTDNSYKEELEELIYSYDLEENVILTGKISNEELYAYYKGANLFLCMSEHEGFGIPLIEAMLFNTPVIAYNSSNIKNTLNGGGILFNKKSHKYIAGTIELIRTNRAFKRAILDTQKKAIEIYKHKNIVKKMAKYLNNIGVKTNPPKIQEEQVDIEFQFEGPFDSSYSLAILNRYSALEFEKIYSNKVSLYPTEGTGDYIPDNNFLKQNPKIEQMYKKSQKGINSKVIFRNLYPPKVIGMKGYFNLLNAYGWEESTFPLEYVKEFNNHLDGITVMSNYVRRVLITNGVEVPIKVVGLGVEHILNIKPEPIELNSTKKFRFLHISSAFPRKGVDILLKAYTKTFSSSDDVTLIIKTFPNPHNNIEKEIKKIRENPNSPEIILINKDLKDENIVWLYQNSNALVAPSRGEGFGLPMAEAMLFNLPVITTAFGGQSDFCIDDTAWLIDYSFTKAKTHFKLFDSYWVEPKIEHLKELLKEQIDLTEDKKKSKTQKAYNLILKKFKWKDYRGKTEEFLKYLEDEPIFKENKINLGWVSTYNSKCGIAAYSEFLLKYLRQKHNVTIFANYTKPLNQKLENGVIRCWENRFDKNNELLIQNILNKSIQVIIINFNFSFFSTKNLKNIIKILKEKNIKIIIIFHSVADVKVKGLEASLKDIKDTLILVDYLLVHTIEDLNFFKKIGLFNVELLPHGVINRDVDVETKNIKTIGSYGFFLPHKGILELIEAFAILEKKYPNLKLLLVNALYPVKESEEYFNLCKNKTKELGLNKKIEFETRFLEDKDSFKLLDKSDLIVLPYRKTQESSSASVRFAIATKKPVICTPQPIFSDVEEVVHFTKGYSPKEIASKIEELIKNKDKIDKKLKIQTKWIREHEWKNISNRLNNLIKN